LVDAEGGVARGVVDAVVDAEVVEVADVLVFELDRLNAVVGCAI
jgi:hypothetical protein